MTLQGPFQFNQTQPGGVLYVDPGGDGRYQMSSSPFRRVSGTDGSGGWGVLAGGGSYLLFGTREEAAAFQTSNTPSAGNTLSTLIFTGQGYGPYATPENVSTANSILNSALPPMPHPDGSNLALGPNLGGADAVVLATDKTGGDTQGNPTGLGGLVLIGGLILGAVLLLKR